MSNASFHACDETRGALISKRVDVVDTARVPFNTVVKHMTQISEAGLLLHPFWGVIPQIPTLPAVEILLLSHDFVVLECYREMPEKGLSDAHPRLAGALILPASTIAAARVKAGDQIRICNTEKRVAWDLSNDRPVLNGPVCRCFQTESEPVETEVRTAQVQSAISALEAAQAKADSADGDPVKKMSFGLRILQWVTGIKEGDRRRGLRHRFPKLVAFYWTGGTPKAFRIGDLGPTGFYLITEDRWVIGTRIAMTLQRTDLDSENPEGSITVATAVIHSGPDGVGFAFMGAGIDPQTGQLVPADQQTQEKLTRFLQSVSLEGQPAPPTIRA